MNQTVCCFLDMMRRFETFGRTAGASFAFYVLKELSHSNSSSEAQRWLLPKCGRLCRSLPKRGRPRLISAALEDTTITLLVGSTLAISQTSNPQHHPLCDIRKRLLPSTAFPLVQRLEMQTRGKLWGFQMLFHLLVKQCLQHNVLSRVR